ncbi:MAG: hypothetical protein ACRDV4_01340 [Acidimicrobiales bacterium]
MGVARVVCVFRVFRVVYIQVTHLLLMPEMPPERRQRETGCIPTVRTG